MLTVNGQQFPISDEAYEMVLRAVDADGCDPWLSDRTLGDDGWIAAKIMYVQDPDVFTGYRVRFKEAAGMLSYEFYDLDGEVQSQWTEPVWSKAQLNATPPWPITLIAKIR